MGTFPRRGEGDASFVCDNSLTMKSFKAFYFVVALSVVTNGTPIIDCHKTGQSLHHNAVSDYSKKTMASDQIT